jgi:dTDP-4-dehydrorhamnose 3,5-epimerase
MEVQKTNIDGVILIRPTIFKDKRGYFFESFNQKLFTELTNVKISFVQDNQSLSSKGVLRGLHFQNPPFAQSKLVRVLKGSVMDVAVDIRKESSTYGEFFMQELNDVNHTMMYLPEGVAHGFLTLENNTIFSYKCSNYYNQKSEDSLIWNDPDIGIKWPKRKLILSEKDQNAKKFSSFVSQF